MPLRDHFRPPATNYASWEEVHGAWPSVMAFRLNALLPPGYRSGPKVHLGNPVEIDVATFERDDPDRFNAAGPDAVAWQAGAAAVLLDADELTPPEYEVRVYDERHGRRLVAAVEIVSPRNKDRPDARAAFVSKCHALLTQDVCVAVVDPVTERSANLYAELARRLGADPPAAAGAALYAVSCRPYHYRDRFRVEAWEHTLEVGRPLPTLPVWISETRYVPLELERTYEETCAGLRIA